MVNKQNQTILIVEDEDAMRKSLFFSLKKAGFEVYEASDGEEGLRLALEKHPDLILLDLLMPKKDGFEMLKELRQDNWGEDVPVIILTNLSGSEYVAETIERGVYDHLIKTDWNIDDVVNVVAEKLKE